jgi:hypothetical protein
MDEKDCGLIGVRLEHLANLPNWTAKEAAFFSLGMAPTGALSKSLGAHYAGDSVRFFKNVKIHVDLFERHEDRLTPSEWVRWCHARGIDFHEDLKRLIVSPDPAPAPACKSSEADKYAWIEEAHKLGREIRAQRLAKGWVPSQLIIAEEIEKVWRKQNKQVNGKFVSAGYIKRKALKGV